MPHIYWKTNYMDIWVEDFLRMMKNLHIPIIKSPRSPARNKRMDVFCSKLSNLTEKYV